MKENLVATNPARRSLCYSQSQIVRRASTRQVAQVGGFPLVGIVFIFGIVRWVVCGCYEHAQYRQLLWEPEMRLDSFVPYSHFCLVGTGLGER